MSAFGWDLLYKLSESNLKKKEDVLALVVHFVIIKNGFKCVGIGESSNKASTSSEILPDGWNEGPIYIIRYVRDNTNYLLRGEMVTEQNIVFNFLCESDLTCGNAAFNVPSTVSCLRGSLNQLLKNPDIVLNKIKTNLIDINQNSTSRAVTTQTNKSTGSGTQTGSCTRPQYPSMPIPIDPMQIDPDDPLRVGGVGRSDLDPFGRGGGMIFNPFGNRPGIPRNPGAGIPGGLPSGSIPPGSRFDPVAPDFTPNAPSNRLPDEDDNID